MIFKYFDKNINENLEHFMLHKKKLSFEHISCEKGSQLRSNLKLYMKEKSLNYNKSLFYLLSYRTSHQRMKKVSKLIVNHD